MPVDRLSWALHDIACADALGLSTLVAYPATSGLDLEYLSVFMMVPVCPSTWEEGNMIAHDAVYWAGEFVHPGARCSVLVLYLYHNLEEEEEGGGGCRISLAKGVDITMGQR